MKPYKNLNKRIENLSEGCLGSIVEASRKPDSKIWEIGIKWDCQPDTVDTHFNSANIWKYNRIVDDNYAPDHGDVNERIAAVIEVLQDEPPPYRYGHYTEIPVGKDMITLCMRYGLVKLCLQVNLWAGQGNWQTLGDSVQDATDKMIATLKEYLDVKH